MQTIPSPDARINNSLLYMIQVTPVILCGGSGTRLWPLSRTGFPKQFLCLTGNESLFQQAAQRLSQLGNSDNALAIKVFGIARNVEGLHFPSVACDVSFVEQVKAVSQKLKKDGVRITGFINAAGIASMNLAVTTPASVI
jgi:hypothetical protein